MSLVIDATTAPPVDAMRSAGVVGLCRYLSWLYRWGGTTHDHVNPKIIQQAEYDRLVAAGFGVALNWEYDDHDWLGGASGGHDHAAEAVRQARALGYPGGCVIYGSADFDMTRAQWDSAGHAYAQAFAAGISAGGYAPGVYGPYDVLTWCRDLGGFRYYWQARMSRAWSGGRNSHDWPGAHLMQRRRTTIGGVDCDANDAVQNYGQAGDDMDPKDVWTADVIPAPPGIEQHPDTNPTWTPLSYLRYVLAPLLPAVNAMGGRLDKIEAALAAQPAGSTQAGGQPTQDQVNAAVLAALKDPEIQAGLGAAIAAHLKVV